MKKMILPAVIAMTLLQGCGYDRNEAIEKRHREEDRNAVTHFRKVAFEGHSYILYRQLHGPSLTHSGLTHDPDCECGEKLK